MSFDVAGSWFGRERQGNRFSRWLAGRAHWHGSLHSGANKRFSPGNLLPATPSDLNWLAEDKPVLFLLVLLSYIIIAMEHYR